MVFNVHLCILHGQSGKKKREQDFEAFVNPIHSFLHAFLDPTMHQACIHSKHTLIQPCIYLCRNLLTSTRILLWDRPWADDPSPGISRLPQWTFYSNCLLSLGCVSSPYRDNVPASPSSDLVAIPAMCRDSIHI